MHRRIDLAVYMAGLVASGLLAAAVMGCGTVQTRLDGCDPDVAHAEMLTCVTDADVPVGPEQTAQVVAWCAARAALKACPPVRSAALGAP